MLNKKSFFTTRWVLLLVIVLATLLGTAGCSSSGTTQTQGGLTMASMAGMPKEVKDAPQTVQQSYQFAVANPDVLQEIPCYCGCGAAGHTSNYACYVQSIDDKGNITFDPHALGCSICVDITQDTMRLMRDGKPTSEIRAYIDQTYSQYGPSNIP